MRRGHPPSPGAGTRWRAGPWRASDRPTGGPSHLGNHPRTHRRMLDAVELLKRCQQIEQQQGRIRLRRWGERTIDLDILMFDDLQLEDESLTLPHPGLHLREFVLYPLHRIDRTLEIPGRGMLDELIKNCPQNGLEYLGYIEGYEK